MKDILLIIFLSITVGLSAQETNQADRLRIANELETTIHQMLNAWYPKDMDTMYGGFLSNFTYDFKPTGNQEKFIVTQGRHTWSNCKAAMRYPNVPYYKTLAQDGYKFLHDVMWDKT